MFGSFRYDGDRRPDVESHSLIWAPVSASRALRISLSRSTPGGVPRASFRRRSASAERRVSSGSMLNVLMARSFPFRGRWERNGRSHHRQMPRTGL